MSKMIAGVGEYVCVAHAFEVCLENNELENKRQKKIEKDQSQQQQRPQQ